MPFLLRQHVEIGIQSWMYGTWQTPCKKRSEQAFGRYPGCGFPSLYWGDESWKRWHFSFQNRQKPPGSIEKMGQTNPPLQRAAHPGFKNTLTLTYFMEYAAYPNRHLTIGAPRVPVFFCFGDAVSLCSPSRISLGPAWLPCEEEGGACGVPIRKNKLVDSFGSSTEASY